MVGRAEENERAVWRSLTRSGEEVICIKWRLKMGIIIISAFNYYAISSGLPNRFARGVSALGPIDISPRQAGISANRGK